MKKKILLILILLLMPLMVFAEDEEGPELNVNDIPNLTCIYYAYGANAFPVMVVQTNKSGVISRDIQYAGTLDKRNSAWAPNSKADKQWAVIQEANLNTSYTTKKTKTGNWLLGCPKYALFDEGGIYSADNKYTTGSESVKQYPPKLTLIDENYVRLAACKNNEKITTDEECIEEAKKHSNPWSLKEVNTKVSEYREGDEYGTTTDDALLNDPNAITCEYQYMDLLKMEIKFNEKKVAISKEERLTDNNFSSSLSFTGEEIYHYYKNVNKCPELGNILQGTTVFWNLPPYTPYTPTTGDKYALPPIDSTKDYINNDKTCNGVLGETMTKVVNNIFTTVQFLGPVLVIVMSIIDFSKAAISGEAEDMKKAQGKLIKRIICAILLFFVPLLCKLLFSITGVTVPDTCIGK